ncbi:MAG: hypothetical protein H7124_11525 [Phycisphaerales bacterium]|nr:hypothetical protein [Hyphomonadaceae bacterium]
MLSRLAVPLRLARQVSGVIRGSWRRAVQQERILATAVFALIAATAMTGLDYVVTGGAPDWNAGGEAFAEDVRVRPSAFEAAVPAKIDVPEPIIEARLDRGDHSFTIEELLGGPLLAAADAVAAPELAAATAIADFAPAWGKPAAANPL